MIKKLSAILLLLSFSAQAGSLPPTTIKGQSDLGVAPTTFNLQAPNSQITRLGGVNALIETGNANTLVNPNASGGTAGYSVSSGTFASGGSGNSTYFSFDSGASGEIVSSGYQTVSNSPPDQWSGQNGVVSAKFKCSSGTCTHKLQVYDGTTVLAEGSITSTVGTFSRTSLNFIYPASGTVRWQLVSVAADEPEVEWLGGYRGLAEGFNLTQATGLAGSPWIDFTPVIGNSGTTWSVGSPTQYRRVGESMQLRGYVYSSSSGSGGPTPPVTIGIPGPYAIDPAKAGDLSGTAEIYNINGGVTSSFNVTGISAYDSTSVAMNNPGTGAYIHGSDLGNPAQIHFNFEVPIAGWTAQVNGLNALGNQYAASWSGYQINSSGWVQFSSTMSAPTAGGGISTTTLASKNITCASFGTAAGITCQLPDPGTYRVCATVSGTTGAGMYASAQLYTGAGAAFGPGDYKFLPNAQGTVTDCGDYIAPAGGANSFQVYTAASSSNFTMVPGFGMPGTINWSIMQLDHGQALPYFTGSVTSSSAGQERIARVRVDTVCNADPCTIASQNNSVSSISRVATGAYIVNFIVGTFSSAPTCNVTCNAATANPCGLAIDPSSLTSTAFPFSAYQSNGTPQDTNGMNIQCSGPR